MRNHRLSCPLFMTATSHLPGDAGVDHIFTATHTATDGQDGRIIGMIISSNSHGIGVMVMTDTGREIPLIIGIIGPRMERCQSSCPSPDTVQAVVQFIHRPSQFADVSSVFRNGFSLPGSQVVHLFHVHRISVRTAVSHIGDLLAVGVQAIAGNVGLISHVVFFRRDGLSAHSPGIAFNGHILQVDLFLVQAQFKVRAASTVLALAIHLDVILSADRGVLPGCGVNLVHPGIQPGHPIIQVVDGSGDIFGPVRIFQSIMELDHIPDFTGLGHIFDHYGPLFLSLAIDHIHGNAVTVFPVRSVQVLSDGVFPGLDMLFIVLSRGSHLGNGLLELAFRSSFGGTDVASGRSFLVGFGRIPLGIAQIAYRALCTAAADHNPIGSYSNAVVFQSHAACLKRSICAQIDIFVQSDFDMPIGIRSCRFRNSCDISIPYNADGLAQYLGNFFILIIRQFEAAGLGSQGHLLDGGSQLGFRSRPVLHIVGLVPGSVVQTGDVIPFIGAYPVFLFADDQADGMSFIIRSRSKGNGIHASQIRLEPIGKGSSLLDQGQVVPGIEGYRISGRNLFVHRVGRFIRLAAAAGFSGSCLPVSLVDGFRHVLGGNQTIICHIDGLTVPALSPVPEPNVPVVTSTFTVALLVLSSFVTTDLI